jgi:2'-5' RNA ligase
MSPRERPGSPRTRLFLALELPGAYRAELAAWRDRALASDDLRPVAEGQLHVTLVFLGWQYERDVERIAATAFEPVRGLPPAALAARAVKAVPPRRPRLFALDLEDSGGGASAVQAAAAAALAAARFYEPEARPFWPHVTLARVKRGRPVAQADVPAPPGDRFDASVVTLYRSTLRPQGALYEPLERLDLG